MRLRSIELKGFKSFADKTIIYFDQNITGIVGPNGCGKSNIVDAIRWVLGEQKSKALRLEKMDNVIFNGTKERHPANIAEVSMTLDNTKNLLPTEFSSVTIKRIIARDGSSEYQLNGVSCRLKDIRDLFLDTGISTDTYAIIELKMIDNILNDVEKARRGLLEQAAGISKYKTRKHETLLKLESTEADLTRVEDLLFEIEKNLKGLESQAKKAKKYKILKEEYRDITLKLTSFELMEINRICELKQSEIQSHETQIISNNTQINILEAERQKIRLQVIEGESALSGEQKKLNEFINHIQQVENEKKLLEQQNIFETDRQSQLQRDILKAENQIVEFRFETEKTQVQALETEQHLLEAKKQLEQISNLLELKRVQNVELRNKQQQIESGLQRIRQKLFSEEKNLTIQKTELQSLTKSAQQSLFDNEERKKQLDSIEGEIKEYNNKIEKQARLVKEIEEKEITNQSQIQVLQQEIESKRNELIEKQRVLDAKQNELKLTKNMVESLQGFPDSIKYLKKNITWLKDKPLLSDVIYSKEQYRAAIETVLQPYLNNIIVETEAEALQAIQILHEQEKGKVGFLILNLFDNFKGNTSVSRKLPDDVKPILEIIETDTSYQNILAYLLRDTFISEKDNIEESGQFQNNFEGKIVNATGQILRTKYQITGGSSGSFEGKRLGRLKNLERLTQEVENLNQIVDKHKSHIAEMQRKILSLQTNSLKTTIEREQRALVEMEKNLFARKAKIENFKDVFDKTLERYERLIKDIETLKEAIIPIQKNCEEFQNNLTTNSELLESHNKSYKKEADAYHEIQQQYNQQNILFIQKENHFKSLQQAILFKTNQSKLLLDEVASKKEAIENLGQKLKNNLLKIEELNTFLLNAYEEKSKKMTKLSENETKFFGLKQKERETEDAIREQEKGRRQTEEKIVQFKEQFNEQKVKLGVLKDRLAFEFKIEIESLIQDLKIPDESQDTLKSELEKVRNRLDRFGEVNPMAEEAYDEMKRRYDFIIEQKNDLVEAKNSLLQTIQEVDTTARTQFMETFASVRENFIQVFRSMFTEDDSCDLIIVNPEEVLESEIDIVAKPKGKRPQSINQLSGGEKTLTALSLLFALYLYKPAPFCILDEVDAPLDDNNIDKYNKAIRKFSDNSQFIIVTHNKSTMAEVDNIYGVTMVKQGVSRVVPVDFSNLN